MALLFNIWLKKPIYGILIIIIHGQLDTLSYRVRWCIHRWVLQGHPGPLVFGWYNIFFRCFQSRKLLNNYTVTLAFVRQNCMRWLWQYIGNYFFFVSMAVSQFGWNFTGSTQSMSSLKFLSFISEVWFPWQPKEKKCKHFFSQKVGRISNMFCRNVTWAKNMAIRVGAVLSYNIWLRIWQIFQMIFLKMFHGWPSTGCLQAMLIGQKKWPTGAVAVKPFTPRV